jgi:hypothetical protein
MSAFALLADLDEDGKIKTPKKKSRKTVPVVNTGSATAAKPKLTAEQKAILAERKAAREEAKKERALKKEIEARCHFFEKCGKPRQGDWFYCKECYTSITGKCELCTMPTTLSGTEPGVLHTRCVECRH